MNELVASGKCIDIKQYQYNDEVVYMNKWSGKIISEIDYLKMILCEYVDEWYTNVYQKYYDHNIINYLQERLMNDVDHDWMIKHKEVL